MELKTRVTHYCPSEEDYSPEWYVDGPNVSPELAAMAERLSEARLFKFNSHHLCRPPLVCDDPRNPTDVIYYVRGSMEKK
eukprot:4317120-Alexandrium_andersonii.AAC.1